MAPAGGGRGKLPPVELTEVMRTTAAAREYTDAPVPDDVLYRVLDNARFAPSGGNQQPWSVIVLRDPERRRRIRELVQITWREYVAQGKAGVRAFAPGPDGRWHGPAVDLEEARRTPAPSPFVDRLEDTPVLLVVLARLTAVAVMDVELERQSIVGGASIYPFVQNILLAARDEGLGGTITTFLARQEPGAAPILDVPPDHAIAAVVALGYPVKQVTRLKRRPVESFTHLDTFTGPPLPAP